MEIFRKDLKAVKFLGFACVLVLMALPMRVDAQPLRQSDKQTDSQPNGAIAAKPVFIPKTRFADDLYNKILDIQCQNPNGHFRSCYFESEKECRDKFGPIVKKSIGKILVSESRDIQVGVQSRSLARQIAVDLKESFYSKLEADTFQLEESQRAECLQYKAEKAR